MVNASFKQLLFVFAELVDAFGVLGIDEPEEKVDDPVLVEPLLDCFGGGGGWDTLEVAVDGPEFLVVFVGVICEGSEGSELVTSWLLSKP